MSDSKGKAPSQIFTWFEKMKENYDRNILTILQRFEQNNNKQQTRLDETHKNHINIMHEQYANQTEQLVNQITKKEQEIAYFKQQISLQQQTISQLTNKYDKVMVEFIASSKASNNFKDIFDDNDFINIENNQDINKEANAHADHISLNETVSETQGNESRFSTVNTEQDAELEKAYQQALQVRKGDDKQQAFSTFKQIATLGHVQSMGALGRAYFIGEGVEESPVQGLAWLINAANLGLPQAISRVELFKNDQPKLYQDAMLLAQALTSESLTTSV